MKNIILHRTQSSSQSQEAITVTKKATDETETDNSAEFTDKDFAKLDKEAQAKDA